MEILVVNFDLAKDPFTKKNFSVEKYENNIRRYNTSGTGSMFMYNPFGNNISDFEGIDYVFNLYRSNVTEGIMSIGVPCGPPRMIHGYPGIDYLLNIVINPKYLPALNVDTLIAYMPHIPWDEFGNHIRISGDDAENLMKLWKTFLHQKGAYFKAINDGDCEIYQDRSVLGYIYINNNEDLEL